MIPPGSDFHESGLGVLLVVHGDGGAYPVFHGVWEGGEGALGVAHHADGASRVQDQNLSTFKIQSSAARLQVTG